jgi:DNA polymerase III, subunit gamma and tau
LARRALYREYRPETFSEVIGQDHITTILKNQVREGKLSHAYLFCGSRGTGKTSSAKILSRAVNCLDPKDGEPCGECTACRLIKNGSADVIEIDAASNNSVDNVRSLIEQAQFAPLELKYRVFIIDEVHMLSNAAFNALLKTLEEPPKHVLFILATTEPQKLPATIVSRCQRFDFHRLTIAHIVTNLTSVLSKAGASIEPNGLRLIARAADGGMRDALSLADQCLSYAGNSVSEQDVLDALGTVSSAMLEDTAKALLSGDAAGAVRALDEAVKNGRDLGVFLNDLSRHFRALLLSKTCGDCADLLDCTDDQMQRYLKTAKAADEARILYAMEQLLAVQSRLKLFTAPRIPIETAFVRICRPLDDTSLGALEARVALLEARPRGQSPSHLRRQSPLHKGAKNRNRPFRTTRRRGRTLSLRPNRPQGASSPTSRITTFP